MVSLLFDRDDCADEAGCLISPAELAWKDAVESGEVEQTGECLQETYDRSEVLRFRDMRERAKNHDLPVVQHSRKIEATRVRGLCMGRYRSPTGAKNEV